MLCFTVIGNYVCCEALGHRGGCVMKDDILNVLRAYEREVAALLDVKQRAQSEADRYRVVLEWLEENNPAALELCPHKAPTGRTP